MKSPWATPDDPRMSEAPAHPPDPIRDTLDAIRESQTYPSPCPVCRGTGGGTWNDCPACDGNGVV